MSLKERCNTFLSELGVPTTVFCRKIGICTRSFYDWRNGNEYLSAATLARIDRYISKYGF